MQKKARRFAILAGVSLAVCYAFPGRALAVALDQAAFCADASGVHFDVTVSGEPDEIIFRIAADGGPFGSPVERFAVNFDGTTGEVTRQDPVVQTSGELPFDRWQDGPVTDFLNDALEPGTWRLTGTLLHGADPFVAGDEIQGIGLRPGGIFSGPLPVGACDAAPLAVDVPSNPAPLLDGRVAVDEWDSAAHIPVAGGYLALQHDRVRLYILINMLEDGTDDPLYAGSGTGFDQFWLMFDVDRDASRSPGVDLRYRLQPGGGNLRFETFCDDCLFGFNLPSSSSFSARADGFGCFLGDGSATFRPRLTCDPHRVWELAIDLEEIDARESSMARLGYLIQSSGEDVTAFPENLDDLGRYIQLQLLGQTASGSGEQAPLAAVGFAITQAIQDDFNTVPLVAGKRTRARVFMAGDGLERVTGIVSLKASRRGVDLPGSPLAGIAATTQTIEDLRGNPWTRNWVLPVEWTAGEVQFELAVRRPWVQTTSAQSPVRIPFLATETPTWWTVPVDLGSENNPNLPTDNFIQTAERAALDVLPVATANFVRRPALLTGLVGSGQLKDELNELDAQAVLAWTFGLLFTGEPPFRLPDAIIGITAQSLCTDANCTTRAGGSSDATWGNGNGRVLWGGPGATSGDLVLAHELNHILDTSSGGTWGRHAPGCGAGGTDPNWPSSGNAIGEWGVRTRDGWVIPPSTPDLMSYCRALSGPVKWISEYRWRALLEGAFSTSPLERASGVAAMRSIQATASTTGIGDVYYVRGRVFQSGAGELEPVRTLPGTATPAGSAGTHAVRVAGCAGEVLWEHRFTPVFTDVEGNPQSRHPFSVRLPATGNACAIRLLANSDVLAEQVVTPNSPFVRVLSPNGGERISGGFAVSWQASDADGDALSFTVLYSPDGGATWRPVAGGIAGNSTTVDASTLPASDTARVRVIATDGVNTRFDDSDNVFSVLPSPPRVVILGVAPNALVEADTWIRLEGVAYGPAGERLEDARFAWFVDGEAVGLESSVAVRLTAGTHRIRLEATPVSGPVGTASIDVTAFAGPFASDVAGDAPSGIDLLGFALQTDADRQRLDCELTVASGSAGLPRKSQFVCNLDFGEAESEAVTGCDADGDGLLTGVYRLGSNGRCETADMSLKFRPSHRAACTGAGTIRCEVEEFGAAGESDTVCDGDIAGRPAGGCRIRISAALHEIRSMRNSRCDNGECSAGGDPDAGAYPVYGFAAGHLPPLRDRAPNTDDGEAPNVKNEARLILVPAPPH